MFLPIRRVFRAGSSIPCAFLAGLLLCLLVALCNESRQLRRIQDCVEIWEFVLSSQEEYIVELATDLGYLKRYPIPYDYFLLLKQYSQEYGLDLDFMLRLMCVESGFNLNARSSQGAHGLMQVKFSTAREIDSATKSFWQLYDPETNIRIGTAYFRQMLDRYNGDYRLAALAYNCGPTLLEERMALGHDLDASYFERIRSVGIDK